MRSCRDTAGANWMNLGEGAVRRSRRRSNPLHFAAAARIGRAEPNLVRSGRKPEGSSTAAQDSPWSAPGIRRKLHLGCACYTCHSCHSRCWSELLKVFGTAFLNVQSQLLASAGQARERKLSNACARKMPALTSPITAVTVSIIFKLPSHPGYDKTTAALHSQKDSRAPSEIGDE